MYLPENIPERVRIQKVLESLSESTKEQAKVELVESEGGTVDAQTMLKVQEAQACVCCAVVHGPSLPSLLLPSLRLDRHISTCRIVARRS